MKAQRNIRLVVLFAVLLSAFSAKAQLDTAWIEKNYIHQYIVPHLVDSTLENYYFEVEYYQSSELSFTIFSVNDENHSGQYTNRTAQRYDVSGSLSLSGVAVLVGDVYIGVYDSVRVGILDTSLNLVYEKAYISGGKRDGNYEGRVHSAHRPWYMEFIFDDTITITDDHYFVFVESSAFFPCENMYSVPMTHFAFARKPFDIMQPEYISCGYNTKYKPYVGICAIREGEWIYVEDVTNWGTASNYQERAYWADYCDCDSTIYPPLGIFPIRALENSSIEGVLGQKDVEESVNLYPNPAKGFVTIDSESNIVKIEVYNVLNQLVETLAANSKTLTLDLKSYTSGTYFAKITTDLGITTKRFVVE